MTRLTEYRAEQIADEAAKRLAQPELERTCQLLRLGNEDVCSFCGYAEEIDSAYIPSNYCPNCGAKVEVEHG